MKQTLLLSLILLVNCLIAQEIVLLNEDFKNGTPSNWIHCSSNWGNTTLWETNNEILEEASGPYFGRVINAVQLSGVNLTSVDNPILEFDYSLLEIDSNVILSLIYSTDSICDTQWDTLENIHNFTNGTLVENLEATDTTNGLQHAIINLSQLPQNITVFIRFVSDYRNYFASGKWWIDNIKISGNTPTSTSMDPLPNLNMHPNPVESILIVKGLNTYNPYQILSSTGQIILTGNGGRIDVGTLATGVYYLMVNGYKVSKFIKK